MPLAVMIIEIVRPIHEDTGLDMPHTLWPIAMTAFGSCIERYYRHRTMKVSRLKDTSVRGSRLSVILEAEPHRAVE